MSHAEFVHLRVHSAYSLLEGALRIKDLVNLCRANKMPAVAITDTNNLFGALEFSQACMGAGVQPIIGCQLDIVVDPQETPGTPLVADPLVLLCRDEAGYGNLLKLVSAAHLTTDAGDSPHVTLERLREHSEGLIALSGGVGGPLGHLLANGQLEKAEAVAAELASIFDGAFYLELSRRGLTVEAQTEAAVFDLADKLNLPLVATNEAFFGDTSEYEAHDALLCVAGGTYVGEQERRRVTPEHRLRSAAEMRSIFADIPEALDNTLAIARRCAVMAEPRDPILPRFPTEKGLSETDQLAKDAADGLDVQLEIHVFTAEMDDSARAEAAQPYRERLEFELGVIGEMGFPGYFLIVADFIKWAKEKGIPVGPGRGSGAGSVVAWALTITDLDPLRWGLLFERFLNPERVSMPDFDVDFCQERRDEVIRYVQDKYGVNHVAQIITFGKLQARAVLRDVGRVLQMPYGQIDRICKLVPNNPASPVTLQEAIDGEPMLKDMRREDDSVARLMDMALQLEGLYRHASTHAAGVVIGDRPLDELIPLYRDPRSDMPVTQFNMKDVEKAGLVKFDFLGLKTLSVLQRAVEHLRDRGVDLDLSTLPLDDPASYEMMSRGDTTGVFQLESTGMRDVLRRLKPDRFEDIIAVVALYRPGPMENIPSYIARKHDEEVVTYQHDLLEPVLKETFGIPIYQEQVQQMARDLAGYTLGGADLLRRAMGKKIKAEMDAQRETFVNGCAEHSKIGKPLAERIFDTMAAFAGYGFNKSHAAAYALVAYQTAYLKANYPVEFLAASMTFDMGNTDRLAGFRRELMQQGIDLLPPDINASDARFTVEEGAVRYALGALKNVGVQAMAELAAERRANGPFKSLGDLAGRLDPQILNKRQMENLVRSGAFDPLMPNRKRLFEGLERVLKLASSAARDRNDAQENLFGDAAETAEAHLDLPDMIDWPEMDRLRHEFDVVGFYLSAHPLDSYAANLKRLKVLRYADLAAQTERGVQPGAARLAGTVTGWRERRSARGNKFAFIQLSDSSGMYEVTAFSEVLSAARELLEEASGSGVPVLITTEVKREENAPRLLASAIVRLDSAMDNISTGIRVVVANADAVAALKSVLERDRDGRGEVTVIVPDGAREIEMTLPRKFTNAPATRQAIKSLPGIQHVEEV